MAALVVQPELERAMKQARLTDYKKRSFQDLVRVLCEVPSLNKRELAGLVFHLQGLPIVTNSPGWCQTMAFM
eukprot:2324584-Lingulodinium_polyedra.AAC.1